MDANAAADVVAIDRDADVGRPVEEKLDEPGAVAEATAERSTSSASFVGEDAG
jgi:hypothetical protein